MRCVHTAQATATKAASAIDSAGASLAQTRALAKTLAADPDPKVQNSKFLHFLSKMSRGELYIDDNQVGVGKPAWCSPQAMCRLEDAGLHMQTTSIRAIAAATT